MSQRLQIPEVLKEAQPLRPCPECNGREKVFYGRQDGEEETCRTCGGWGEVLKEVAKP